MQMPRCAYGSCARTGVLFALSPHLELALKEVPDGRQERSQCDGVWLRHWQRRLGEVTLTTKKAPVPWKMFTAAGSGQGSCIPALVGRIGTEW